MKIDYLANHKHLMPMVTQWYFDAFGRLSKNPSLERAEAKLYEKLNTNELDICFLCFHDEKPIGMASLTKNDIPKNIPNHENLTPVLSHLFVPEEYRRQKVGEILVEHAKQQARNLEFKKIYLYTTDKTIHLWYEKLGWKIVQDNILGKFNIKILEMKL